LSILLVTCFHAFPELEKDRTGYILCRKKKATVRLADHKMPSSISHPLEDWNRLVALDHSKLASCILAQFRPWPWPFQVSRVLHSKRKRVKSILQPRTCHSCLINNLEVQNRIKNTLNYTKPGKTHPWAVFWAVLLTWRCGVRMSALTSGPPLFSFFSPTLSLSTLSPSRSFQCRRHPLAPPAPPSPSTHSTAATANVRSLHGTNFLVSRHLKRRLGAPARSGPSASSASRSSCVSMADSAESAAALAPAPARKRRARGGGA